MVTANGNAVASGSKLAWISGRPTGGNGAHLEAVRLIIQDDEAPLTALVLSSNPISESGGIATVTATPDRQSSVAVTVAAVTNAGAADCTLSTAATLTFAANATVSTGLATVTAATNTADAPDKTVTISGRASDSTGRANHPPDVTLAITDDAPTASLHLSPSSVPENGGLATVAATLSHPSSEPSTVTAVSGSYTAGTDATIVIAAGATTAASDTAAGADDFTLSTAATLTFAANATTSTGLVTANGNDVDSPNKPVTVSGTAAGGNGVTAPPNVTLTDDDALPTVALALSSTSISETGGVRR